MEKEIRDCLIHLARDHGFCDLPVSYMIAFLGCDQDPMFDSIAAIAHHIAAKKCKNMARFNAFIGVKNYDDPHGLAMRKLVMTWEPLLRADQSVIFGVFWIPLGEKIQGEKIELLIGDLAKSNFDAALLTEMLPPADFKKQIKTIHLV